MKPTFNTVNGRRAYRWNWSGWLKKDEIIDKPIVVLNSFEKEGRFGEQTILEVVVVDENFPGVWAFGTSWIGVRRSCRALKEADAYPLPGRIVKVKARTVSGYVYRIEDIELNEAGQRWVDEQIKKAASDKAADDPLKHVPF